MTPRIDPERCWQAVLARDAAHDGSFVYGVRTTGVYCRPSCASRRPLRHNVSFHASPAEAAAAGLRACKRCRPDAPAARDPMARKVDALRRHLEAHADRPLTLAAMARQVHASPFHLQRSFKALLGVTPREYLQACRLRALREGLRDGASVTEAIYAAGYGSASRVYERAATHLGMTPRAYREGGRDVDISYAIADTPYGALLIAATDRGLCSVQFGDDAAALRTQLAREFPAARLAPMPASGAGPLAAWRDALCAHLAQGADAAALPLDVRGTAFQLRVWRYLQSIPAGEVRSYTEVAQAIGAPRAVRAVANACGANPVAIVIPCHRVIRGDGALGGFRWGLARKRTLLAHERAARGTGA